MAIVQELGVEGLVFFFVLVEEEKHVIGDPTLQQCYEMCKHRVIKDLLFDPFFEGTNMIPEFLPKIIKGMSGVHDHQSGFSQPIKLKQTRLIHLK